jgi:hypothetical protein
VFDGIKRWAARREAASLGEEFGKQGGNVLEFLKRHKAKVGAIFAAVSAWGAVQGCPPLVGVDVLVLLHRLPLLGGLTCEQINVGVGVLGAFLGGAGLLNSDKHEAVIQGVKAPEGPPAIAPPAELKRVLAEDEAARRA